MKLFIVCLACYNENQETRSWFDVSDFSSSKELERAIDESTGVCSRKHLSHEEIAIHDFEGFPRNMGEHTSIETVFEYLDVLEEIGNDDAAMTLAEFFFTIQDFLRDYSDYSYCGKYSKGDYAYELELARHGEETRQFIENNVSYIDFDAIEDNEYRNNGYLFLDSSEYGKRHVFSPNY